MLGSSESERPKLTITMKLFLKISNLCDDDIYLNVTDGQTDGQMTCRSITALCVASRGKKKGNSKLL